MSPAQLKDLKAVLIKLESEDEAFRVRDIANYYNDEARYRRMVPDASARISGICAVQAAIWMLESGR